MATMPLGSAFALLITHERRHLVQAQRLYKRRGFREGRLPTHLRWSPAARRGASHDLHVTKKSYRPACRDSIHFLSGVRVIDLSRHLPGPLAAPPRRHGRGGHQDRTARWGRSAHHGSLGTTWAFCVFRCGERRQDNTAHEPQGSGCPRHSYVWLRRRMCLSNRSVRCDGAIGTGL